MKQNKVKEGLSIFRFLLVWSSLSPVFIIWAVKGTEITGINDWHWGIGCFMLFITPNILIYIFYKVKKSQGIFRSIRTNSIEEKKEHLVTFLFAMLIPFFSTDADSWREISSILLSFFFVLILFWHLKLHYVNLIFASFGYKIYKASTYSSTYSLDRGEDNLVTYFILSKHLHLKNKESIKGVSLGGNVLIDLHGDKNDR